ncbi:cilia- and flagella-associated protein 36-like isoform X2 [Ptychodera flava]|uniref:cilia- and flagella-associated protein 36-like isoform X2 n=1 Tax=Ptychodera flava TaxID=63121 RepID=UPI00396A5EC7
MADWVFDSVFGFLHSPMWTVPIVNFIEHKCLVFDPEEDNTKVYTEIHGEYKELVEFLLENFLEDVGITSDQFVSACKTKVGKQSDETYSAFEQVEAAQDYEIFKRMMIQKNIELELQALRLIQERNGVIPESMTPGEKSSVQYSQAQIEDEEERILQEVLRKSKEEYEAQQKKKSPQYDTEMEKALAHSKDDAQRLEEEQQKEKDMLEKALKMSLSAGTAAQSQSSVKDLPTIPKDTKAKPEASKGKTPAPVPTIQEPPSVTAAAPAAKKKDVSGAEAAASWLSSAKAEAEASRPGSTASRPTDAHSKQLASSDAAELKRREEYLKQQRDKLLVMKKKEREKTLDTFTATSQGRDRPRSARAAKQATKEEGKPQSAEMSAEDQKKLAMRQALAARLKQEVINKK